MDAGLADSTDWIDTRLPLFAALDGSLRCQVCKDFFSNAVITSCSHTFCSICIRRCLAADGKCPTCRTTEQEVKLRRNVGVQEATDAFVAARPDAFQLAKEERPPPEGPSVDNSRRSSKRKRVDMESNGNAAEPPRTRNQRRRATAAQEQATTDNMVVDNSESDGGNSEYEPEDGLVACPMCKKRMKEELVFPHLDACNGEQNNSPAPQSRLPGTKLSAQPTAQTPSPERLPQLNYSLYNENSLRKKLTSLGIPTWGQKQLLVRRHVEWINLWNAECDSAHPRSKRQLLQDLDAWERSQGGRARENKDSAIMNKDFDGVGWAKQNKSDFDLLIANARQKRKQPVQNPEQATEEKQIETDETSSAGVDVETPSASTSKPILTPLEISSTSSQNGESRTPASLPHGSASTSVPEQGSRQATSPLKVQDAGWRSSSAGKAISPEDPLPRRFSLTGNDVRQVPMFEVPTTPVVDSDRGAPGSLGD